MEPEVETIVEAEKPVEAPVEHVLTVRSDGNTYSAAWEKMGLLELKAILEDLRERVIAKMNGQ